MGLSVVSQTLCKIDVLPAFARPMISTRKSIFGSRRGGSWESIAAATSERAKAVDPVHNRLVTPWVTQSSHLLR